MAPPRLRSSWPQPANAVRPVERPSQESSIVSDTLAILAGGWGVLMAISPALQIRRIIERRSSDDVSLRYYGVLLVGFTLWVAYGLSIGNLALIVSNSVAFVVGSATVLIARRYRTAPEAANTAAAD
jgi:uncharacterized protein with PQ loop repeat